jgi:hypothetical protein
MTIGSAAGLIAFFETELNTPSRSRRWTNQAFRIGCGNRRPIRDASHNGSLSAWLTDD